jgi:hypothetical protein
VLPRPWGPPWPGGSWPPLAAGAVTLTAGSASLLALNCQSPVWILAAVSVVFGAQNGLSLVTSQAAMYAQAPAAQTGTAAGLRTFMYLGAIASASRSSRDDKEDRCRLAASPPPGRSQPGMTCTGGT